MAGDSTQDGKAAGFRALVDRIPYARFLGISVVPDGDGGFLTRLGFSDHLVGNPQLPALHGGVLGSLLEMAAILELLRQGEARGVPKTIDLTVDYLRSAGARDTFARATITKHGRRVANVRVEAWQEDPARPVAAAHAHFLLPRPADET